MFKTLLKHSKLLFPVRLPNMIILTADFSPSHKQSVLIKCGGSFKRSYRNESNFGYVLRCCDCKYQVILTTSYRFILLVLTQPTLDRRKNPGQIRSVYPNMINHFAN